MAGADRQMASSSRPSRTGGSVARVARTAVAVGSLALGIGATAAVFSLVDALLFRPFAVHRIEELVAVKGEKQGELYDPSVPDFRDLRDVQEVFSGLAAQNSFRFSVRTRESTERLSGELVSANYFDVLGVVPRPGRGFLAGEDEAPSTVAGVRSGNMSPPRTRILKS